MVHNEIEKDAIFGYHIQRQFAKEPKRFECYICRKIVEYSYIVMSGKLLVAFAQRDNRPICHNCYIQLGIWDRFITKIFRFIKGGLNARNN